MFKWNLILIFLPLFLGNSLPGYAQNFISINPREAIYRVSVANNRQQSADTALRKGIELMEKNVFLAAQGELEQALKIYTQNGDKQGQTEALIQLATLNFYQEKFWQAQQFINQAESTIDRTSNNQQRQRLLTIQGLISLETGEYLKGLNYLQRAETGIRDIAASNLNRIGLGMAYRYLGWYQKSQLYLELAVRSPGNQNRRALALNTLGDVLFDLGNYEPAVEKYQQALSTYLSVGNRLGAARAQRNLAKIKLILGQTPAAQKLYAEAEQQAKAIGATGLQVVILNELGLVYLQTGNKTKALENLQQALAITRRERITPVVSLINLGFYYRSQKQYEQAINYYEQGLAWAKKNGDRLNETKALNALGETQLEMKQLPQAIATLQRGISVFESLRPGLRDEQKISLFETQSYAYGLLQTALIAKGDVKTALSVAEKARARAFAEQLAIRLSQSHSTPIDLTIPSGEQIQATAKKLNSTLVIYSIIHNSQGQEQKLFTWVVNPQGEIKFHSQDIHQLNLANITPDTASRDRGLTSLVQQTRNGIVKRNFQEPNSIHGQKSYQILIQPIVNLLPQQTDAKIIFIPQGSLNLVPFAALVDNQGKYLIEKYTISTAPSLQILSLINQKPPHKSPSPPLIIGNPEPMPQDLSPLPGAEAEAKAIAQLLQTSAITGKNATEAEVLAKLPSAGIIHLATHGLFDEKQGLQSALALVSSPGQDGMLTALEVLDLKLQAEMAVLSACDTGRGQITGDGVVGLARAFMVAGVPRVIVSLWAVPDEPTAELMKEFYHQKLNTPDRVTALRQAMLKTMKKYPEPVNWAAFTLIGQH
ncbi:CHAT domain-containing protein [Calothrix sp. NIES-3974]|uniref:CHAT domain-containing protein n=1 Tax=Calothrix sp. NIES-3974 TaxID=2005462 RepID=UPI000B5E27A5|nr:CHAT domain-containing tetratricopeptide repeat protein [Calothrix sp. NIES-3974]BAZ03772.1 TPR repeat-containing protein [Calothrix sp. NIES-3974]